MAKEKAKNSPKGVIGDVADTVNTAVEEGARKVVEKVKPYVDTTLKALKEKLNKYNTVNPPDKPDKEIPTVMSERRKRAENKDPTGTAWGVID